jgi:large subunit ribosomal protein L3
MAKGLLARKLGMTQVFNPDGTTAAVTVLETGPCRVLGLRTPEKDGYAAARLAFGTAHRRRVTKPRAGEFRKAGIEPGLKVAEVRDFEAEVGQEITCAIFTEGELVDVAGTSKGKGFQGMVRRWGFGRGPETHGSMNVRKPGSIGATDAARVFKGLRMAGHMGAVRRTVQALRVLKVDPERNLLLVHGSVPGPRGGIVMVRGSVKQKAKK